MVVRSMNSSLGQKIRELRKQRRLTQQDLADGIVTPSMISQIESNRATPSPKLLEQLAHRLDVDIAFFMEDMNQKSDQSQTYRRARALVEAGQHAEAIPLLQSLVSPPAPQFREDALYTELAECYIQLGQFPEAGDMYEHVVQIALERSDPATAVHALYNLGRVYRRCNMPDMARMYWHRASELLRRHSELEMPIALKVASNLGRVCLELKRYRAAIQSYQNALSLIRTASDKSEEAVIYHGLATAYVESGDPNRALETTQRALTLYEQVRNQRGINQCRVNLAVGLRLLGRHREAIAQIDQALGMLEMTQDSIRTASLLVELALNHFQLGHSDEAVQHASAALDYDLSADDKAELYEMMAECSLRQGNHQAALPELNQAIQYAIQARDEGRVIHLRTTQLKCLLHLGVNTDTRGCALQLANDCLTLSSPLSGTAGAG